jgi:hypothetical protein
MQYWLDAITRVDLSLPLSGSAARTSPMPAAHPVPKTKRCLTLFFENGSQLSPEVLQQFASLVG